MGSRRKAVGICSAGLSPAVAGVSRARTSIALTPQSGVSTINADLKVSATRKEVVTADDVQEGAGRACPDTHIWLWSLGEPSRLGARVRQLVRDQNNELCCLR